MRGHRHGKKHTFGKGGGEGGHRGFGHHRHGLRGEEGGEPFIKRILGQGDLRYVILSLLDKKPRHGYEMIKDLEELSSGAYSPSPGVIYPTLTFLEEGGFATAKIEENKKLYKITDDGKKLLKDHAETVEVIMTRLSKVGEKISKLKQWMGRDEAEEIGRSDRSPIRKAMHQLKSELFTLIDANKDKKQQVAEVLNEATEKIRKLKD